MRAARALPIAALLLTATGCQPADQTPTATTAGAPTGVTIADCAGGAPPIRAGAADATVYSGHHAAVTDVAFAPDGATVLSAGDDGFGRVWTAATGTDVSQHRIARYPTAVAWSPNGVCAASADSSGLVMVWSVADGQELVRLTGHRDRVYGLAWSPDGTSLASGSWDGQEIGWNHATGLKAYTYLSAGGVGHLAWSGDRLALATATGDVVVLNGTDGTVARTVHVTDAPLWSLAWSPDGATIAAGVGEYGPSTGGPYGVYLVDPGTGQVTGNITPLTGPVWSLAYAPDGQRLAAAGGAFAGLHPPAAYADYRVAVTTVASGQTAYIGTHTDSVWAVSWAPDGAVLAAASQDGTISLTPMSVA